MAASPHAFDPRPWAAVLAAGLVTTLGGCDQTGDLGALPAVAAAQTGAADALPGPDAPRPTRRTFDDSTTLVVTGRPYVDEVELPGVTLRGIESTPIMAKIGGYVESIGEVNGREIDIGSYVTPETLLAVLKVPEREAEMHEKTAAVARAEAAVEQARARIEQARTMLAVREAEVAHVLARRAEKEALVTLRRAERKRIEALAASGAVKPELLDEATYALGAAEAAARWIASSSNRTSSAGSIC